MKRGLPVTQLGWSVIAISLISAIVGYQLGWIEFVAVAITCLVVLLIAIPFVVGGHALVLERSMDPRRVEVDGRATSVLTVSNAGKGPSSPRVIEDRVGSSLKVIDVPALAPGASTQALLTLPTTRRGIIVVGPAVVAKADPLGLLRRDLGRTPEEHLWVYPRVTSLAPMNSGFVKDLEGPTFDNSPAGDIAFHAVREYQRGDDVRHIHWMSTARKGTLMIRHYVDNRRPHLGVIVDTDSSVYDDKADFERALEVAASQIVSAELEGRPLSVVVGEQAILTSESPGTRNDALDRLCLSSLSDDGYDLTDIYEMLRRSERGLSAVLVVTGRRDSAGLMPLVNQAKKHGGVVVARFVPGGEPTMSLPRAKLIDCQTLTQFAAAWRRMVR